MKNNVLVLNEDSFNDIIEAEERVIVNFYNPQCEECVTFMPEFEIASETLADYNPAVEFAKLDSEKEGSDSIEYPLVKFYENGVVKKVFGGKLNADAFVNWVQDIDLELKEEKEEAAAAELDETE